MSLTHLEKGRQPYGAPSNEDPMAWATAAIKEIRPEWGGDRHKSDIETGGKWFPRGDGRAEKSGWGKGFFSQGGEGQIIRDRLAREVPKIVSEYGWSKEGYNELIHKAREMLEGTKAPKREREERTPEQRAPVRRPPPKPINNMINKARQPDTPPDLLEEEEDAQDKQQQQFQSAATSAWQGGGENMGGGSYSFEQPDISGENVTTYFDPKQKGKAYYPFQSLVKNIDLKKISPDLARLMAAAAGWAMSDDTVRSGGGSPRGERTAAEELQWQDALRRHEKREEEERRKREERRTGADRRRHERSMRSAMRTKKSMDEFPEYMKIQNFWSEKSDEYHRKRPVSNGAIAKAMDDVIRLFKDHAPVPPRQGLIWDATKHKWVRPENHGHSVSEVQGHKRIRGHGTGVHERRVGGHGSGPLRRHQEGRRFRGVADTGTAKPHEAPHPAQRYLSRKGAGSPKLQRRKRLKRFK